jgi:hypothetical protein
MSEAPQRRSDLEGVDAADRCLIFLHLEKTAGESINSVLGMNYPRDRSIKIGSPEVVRGDLGSASEINAYKALDQVLGKIPLAERSRALFVRGHMPYGAHLHIPNRCDYTTVLRNPVSRVISKYQHIVSGSRQLMHERVLRETISLEEYVGSGIDEFQTANYQTRLLSGRPLDAPDQKALEDAKENLEGFLVVGLAERFEETLTLFRRILGLRMPFYITRNVGTRPTPSTRALTIIGERNQLDLELHAFAQGLFADQLSRQTRSFGLEAAMYRAWRPLSRVAARGERAVRAIVGSRSHAKAGR